jgi:hypothetical protein
VFWSVHWLGREAALEVGVGEAGFSLGGLCVVQEVLVSAVEVVVVETVEVDDGSPGTRDPQDAPRS